MHLLQGMGAARVLDVDVVVEDTSVTVDSRPIRARGTTRLPTLPFDPPSDDHELEPIDTSPDPDTDFADDYTDPDPLSQFAPAWAPADLGQALLDEWDATAASRAARPQLVARVLRATAEDTAITSAEKRAVRPAS
jgi:hypothetical protein